MKRSWLFCGVVRADVPSPQARGGRRALRRRIHQHDFHIFQRRHGDRAFVADRRTVARFDAHAVDLDRALGRHEITVAVSPNSYSAVSPAFSAGPARGHPRGSAAHRSSPAMPLASVDERPARSPFGNGLRAPVGAPPRCVGHDPDLEDPGGPVSRLYSACAMPVPALITCTSPASVRPFCPGCPVGDRALADIGDDFHVASADAAGSRCWLRSYRRSRPAARPSPCARDRDSRRTRNGAWHRANRGWRRPGC